MQMAFIFFPFSGFSIVLLPLSLDPPPLIYSLQAFPELHLLVLAYPFTIWRRVGKNSDPSTPNHTK